MDEPVTLNELRADGKAKIDQFIKDYKWLLTPWTKILDSLTGSMSSYYFDNLNSVGDFIDGFMLDVNPDFTPAQLERFLKEQGLDVYTPQKRGIAGHYWVQLAGGPLHMERNMIVLKGVTQALREFREVGPLGKDRPVLIKLDHTRDLSGFFYAPGHWKEKHKKMREVLKEAFNIDFVDNGNSFDTSFQFVGLSPEGQVRIRIKLYCKTLHLFQCESPMKSLGMNMKAIFKPKTRMG